MTQQVQPDQTVPEAPNTRVLRKAALPKWLVYAVAGGALLLALILSLAGVNMALAVVIAYVAFLAAWTAISMSKLGGRKGVNNLWSAVVVGAFLLALLPLISVLFTVITKGVQGIMIPGFFASDMVGVTGLQDQAAAAGTGPILGGIQAALVGTLMITLVATIISVPIGLLTSIYLVEYSRKGAFSRAITFLVDVMTGIPSIVAGLFAAAMMMAFFEATGGSIQRATMGFSASIALSVLMIPVVVRSTEEMLRVVPNELREASYALGVRKWRTIMQVVIPTAISGIASGVTLAIARVAGETAPILVTAGVAVQTNWNPFMNWMMSLPVYIYRQLTHPTAPSQPGPSELRAWGAALVLILIVMALNGIARFIAWKFAPKKSGR